MTNHEAVEFMWTTIHQWVGNLMRDMEARGIELSLDDVANALDRVAFEITSLPEGDEYDDFLRGVDTDDD